MSSINGRKEVRDREIIRLNAWISKLVIENTNQKEALKKKDIIIAEDLRANTTLREKLEAAQERVTELEEAAFDADISEAPDAEEEEDTGLHGAF